jgi:hypothetical protein
LLAITGGCDLSDLNRDGHRMRDQCFLEELNLRLRQRASPCSDNQRTVHIPQEQRMSPRLSQA